MGLFAQSYAGSARSSNEKDENITRLLVLLQDEKAKHDSNFKDGKEKHTDQVILRLESTIAKKEEERIILQQEHDRIHNDKNELILHLKSKVSKKEEEKFRLQQKHQEKFNEKDKVISRLKSTIARKEEEMV